jgi:hypothetical protein
MPLSAAPALGRADVLGDVKTRFDSGDERVFDAPEPDGILPACLICAGLALEDGDVITDAPQQPQDPGFVDHGLSGPSRHGGGELPVGTVDPGELVKVDLSGHRRPADPRDLVVLERLRSATASAVTASIDSSSVLPVSQIRRSICPNLDTDTPCFTGWSLRQSWRHGVDQQRGRDAAAGVHRAARARRRRLVTSER